MNCRRYTISTIIMMLPILLLAQKYNISGVVLENANKKPIPGAVVFISNTTKGCLTDSSGNFIINQVDEVNFHLVVVAKNHESQIFLFTPNFRDRKLRFEVSEKSKSESLLKEVKSESNDSSRLRFAFLAAFKGSSPNADDCNIANPQVLRFQYEPSYKVWSVTSTEPLQLFNESLGYKIVCQLDECYFSANYKMILCTAYSWFRESTTRHKEIAAKWKENRTLTFQGSLLHFMQAFYAGKIVQEGFLVRTVNRIYKQQNEEEYLKAKNVDGNVSGWEPDTSGTGASLHYYVDVVSKNLLPVQKMRKGDTTYQHIFLSYSPYRLQVMYRYPLALYANVSPGWNPISYIQMHDNKDVQVESDGMYFDPSDITITGYWNWMRIADQLPYDYALTDK